MDLVCYCFGHSEDDILKDLAENGRSTILDKIMKAKKSGGCQCAEKNPKGR